MLVSVQYIVENTVSSKNKDSVATFLDALAEGWSANFDDCGADARAAISKISFVGKKQVVSLISTCKSKMDSGLERYGVSGSRYMDLHISLWNLWEHTSW